MRSIAIYPPSWITNELGTFDPDATCPYCWYGCAQVLGGGGQAIRCRCIKCARTFLHELKRG